MTSAFERRSYRVSCSPVSTKSARCIGVTLQSPALGTTTPAPRRLPPGYVPSNVRVRPSDGAEYVPLRCSGPATVGNVNEKVPSPVVATQLPLYRPENPILPG